MKVNEKFARLADEKTLQQTAVTLQKNGIAAEVVADGAQAKTRLFELIPEGAEIMNMTSMTLEAISATHEVLESGRFRAVRNELKKLDEKNDALMRQRLGAAPEWVIGSVHAVTEEGQVMVASNTGSQLGAYAYGAFHVIWVVGAQKVVKNIEEGFRRLHEYSLPLEDERAQKAYGEGSNVSKILIVNKEVNKDRIRMILVKERLGF